MQKGQGDVAERRGGDQQFQVLSIAVVVNGFEVTPVKTEN